MGTRGWGRHGSGWVAGERHCQGRVRQRDSTQGAGAARGAGAAWGPGDAWGAGAAWGPGGAGVQGMHRAQGTGQLGLRGLGGGTGGWVGCEGRKPEEEEDSPLSGSCHWEVVTHSLVVGNLLQASGSGWGEAAHRDLVFGRVGFEVTLPAGGWTCGPGPGCLNL